MSGFLTLCIQITVWVFFFFFFGSATNLTQILCICIMVSIIRLTLQYLQTGKYFAQYPHLNSVAVKLSFAAGDLHMAGFF